MGALAGGAGILLLLAALMIAFGLGAFAGLRDANRPDDGPDMSDLAATKDDAWHARNEADAWAAVRRDWVADQYRAESDSADGLVDVPAGQQ